MKLPKHEGEAAYLSDVYESYREAVKLNDRFRRLLEEILAYLVQLRAWIDENSDNDIGYTERLPEMIERAKQLLS